VRPGSLDRNIQTEVRDNERPRQFSLDEDTFEIESVEDQWRSP